MYYIQGNIIFHFIHAIFDERLFSKYTNFHAKECKLYDELLDKTSPELLVPDSSWKYKPTLIPILHTLIPPIQNNSHTCSPLSSLSYKSTFPPSTLESKNLIVEIEETNDVNSNVEMQPPSSQWPL